MSDLPYDGGSKLWDGPLGVVRISFDGYNLGKTTAESTLEFDQDVLDIIYQQDGSKAADHVRTGQDVILTATFGEISSGLLELLARGITTKKGVNDSGTVNRNLYTSMRETEGGPLKVFAVDTFGAASSDIQDILNCYEAIPILNGSLANWVADAQRGLQVQFRIKWHEFPTPIDPDKPGAFGYWGDPAIEEVDAIVWPDVAAPVVVSSTVVLATTADIVFDENVAFQGGSYPAGSISANVDGVIIVAVSALIATNTVTATFPAASFATNDVVEITVTGIAIEDTETVANLFGGVANFPATNPL